MWERKKSEPQTPAAAPAYPRPTAEDTAYAPVAPAPRMAEPERRSTAVIGKAVRIVGDVISGEDLFIDGEVQGTLQAKDSRLTIGPNGKARSDIKAREVVVQGQVQGNIEAREKITIRKEGSVVGNLRTAGINIEDEAYFKGSIDIVRGEAAPLKAAPAPAAPTAVTA
ncbi:MAG TPA: polymer-forming cytoskeletal protein [Bryobacteraceae bacterium]|nr:polymer-forming cytoskeletal protein [Bryobacteraceae bacterium]